MAKLRNGIGVFVSVVCCWTGTAWGWGAIGHRASGFIAEAYMTPAARAGVQGILRGYSMADAANWADQIRSNDSFKHAGRYHYESLPDRVTYLEDLGRKSPEERSQGSLIAAILLAQRIVEDNASSQEQKQMAVKFLTHFIGDLQQPLHSGPANDRGGNSVRVVWFNDPSNLHAVWDRGIIVTGHADLFSGASGQVDHGLIYARYLIQKLQRSPAPTLPGNVEGWLQESAVSRVRAYDPRLANNQQAYQEAYLPLVDQRVFDSGRRIAEVFNRIFARAPMSAADQRLYQSIERLVGSLPSVITLGPRSGGASFSNQWHAETSSRAELFPHWVSNGL